MRVDLAFLAVLIIFGAMLWIGMVGRATGSTRREKYKGRCLNCGYSRDGIGERPCPECGKPAPERRADGVLVKPLLREPTTFRRLLVRLPLVLMCLSAIAIGVVTLLRPGVVTGTYQWLWFVISGLLVALTHGPLALLTAVGRKSLPTSHLLGVVVGGGLLPSALFWLGFCETVIWGIDALTITLIVTAFLAPFSAGTGWLIGAGLGSIARRIRRA